MADVPPLPLVLLVGATILAFSVAGTFIHRRSDRPGASELSLLLIACGAWSGVYAAGLSSTSKPEMVVLLKLLYVCVAATPLLWFQFATAFTGSKPLPIVGWAIAAGITVSHLVSVFLWPRVTLSWTDVNVHTVGEMTTLSTTKGPLYYVFFVYAYTFLLWGALRLARHVVSTRENYRYQHRIIVVALFVALVPNAAYHASLVPTRFDPTPFAFTVSTLLFMTADRRFQLFRTHPLARDIAREHVIEEMGDGVLVVDRSGIVTDVNPALTTALELHPQNVTGNRLEDVVPSLAGRIEMLTDERTSYHHKPTDKTYDVKVSPFSLPGNGMRGNIVTLHDVTEVRQREERLAVLNRILRHDIRNGLNVVDGYADLVADDQTDSEMIQTSAQRIKDRTEDLLQLAEKIRAVEKGLDHHTDHEQLDLMKTLRAVTDRVSRDWPESTVSLTGPANMAVSATATAESLFDNLVENAAEHGGDNPCIDVSVTTEGKWTTTTISDDGPGIPDEEISAIQSGETPLHHTSGVGLWLVTWLVRQSAGTIDFDVSDYGTTATVRLKRADSLSTADGGEHLGESAR